MYPEQALVHQKVEKTEPEIESEVEAELPVAVRELFQKLPDSLKRRILPEIYTDIIEGKAAILANKFFVPHEDIQAFEQKKENAFKDPIIRGLREILAVRSKKDLIVGSSLPCSRCFMNAN